jgi:hypothetical protein
MSFENVILDATDKLVISLSPENSINLFSRARCFTNRIRAHAAINLKRGRNMWAVRVVALSRVMHQMFHRHLDGDNQGGGRHIVWAERPFGHPIPDSYPQKGKPRTGFGDLLISCGLWIVGLARAVAWLVRTHFSWRCTHLRQSSTRSV